MAALEVRNRMTREEIMALAQAPEVEEARERMLMAAAKVRAMRSNYLAQQSNSDAARVAKDELDDARDAVRKAQQSYNAALAEEADYERIRQEYLAELRRTGRAPAVAGN
jgi:phosphoribosylaminoimidazole carboxylase (NCAIR synthetase)